MGRPGFLENKRRRLRRRTKREFSERPAPFRPKNEKLETDFQLLIVLIKVGNIFPIPCVFDKSWKWISNFLRFQQKLETYFHLLEKSSKAESPRAAFIASFLATRRFDQVFIELRQFRFALFFEFFDVFFDDLE